MKKKTEADRVGLKCFTTINMWLKSTNLEIQVILKISKLKFDIFNMFINILKFDIFR